MTFLHINLWNICRRYILPTGLSYKPSRYAIEAFMCFV
jgi:hypothetical protein